MRVMLIRKFVSKSIEGDMPPPKMEVGDIFNLLDTYSFCGVSFFKLVEFGKDYGFDARHFATLPAQDADEIEAETKEAIIPCPTH